MVRRFRTLTVMLALVLPLLLIGVFVHVSAQVKVTELTITPLDSTLHVQWTPSGDPSAAWQVAVVRNTDGSVQQTKVTSKTANVIQANGLVPGAEYNVRIYDMGATGVMTLTASGQAATDPQSPMCNATFFENFNEAPGPLLTDYFDVRTDETVSAPGPNELLDERQVFNNENHFHTQLIATTGHVEEYLRPRAPFDITDRTGTVQFEMDLPPAQRGHGKWMSVAFVQTVPYSASELGDNEDGALSNSLTFQFRNQDPDDSLAGYGLNRGSIVANINGQKYITEGTIPSFSGTNIRLPIVLKMSATSADMYVNGNLTVHATFPALAFTKGYLLVAHRNYYAQRWFNTYPQAPTMVDQLIHWDTFQYDGPEGSYSPLMRTYVQQGCPGKVDIVGNSINNCSNINLGTYAFHFNLTDDVSLVRSLYLEFNGGSGKTVTANVNGRGSVQFTGTGAVYNKLNGAYIEPSWLMKGQNTITFTASGATIAQVEAEVLFNTPRILESAHVHNSPMLSVTANNFRIDRINSDPSVITATTNIYSLGADIPFTYTAQVVTNSPWLTLSQSSGLLVSPVSGGGVTPLNMRINFGVLGTTDDDGKTAIVKVSDGFGGMPAYIGLMVTNQGIGVRPTFITTYPPSITSYNKEAVPGWHGCIMPMPTVGP